MLDSYNIGDVITEDDIINPYPLPLGGEYDYATITEIQGGAVTFECHKSGRDEEDVIIHVLSSEDVELLLGWDIAMESTEQGDEEALPLEEEGEGLFGEDSEEMPEEGSSIFDEDTEEPAEGTSIFDEEPSDEDVLTDFGEPEESNEKAALYSNPPAVITLENGRIKTARIYDTFIEAIEVFDRQ